MLSNISAFDPHGISARSTFRPISSRVNDGIISIGRLGGFPYVHVDVTSRAAWLPIDELFAPRALWVDDTEVAVDSTHLVVRPRALIEPDATFPIEK